MLGLLKATFWWLLVRIDLVCLGTIPYVKLRAGEDWNYAYYTRHKG